MTVTLDIFSGRPNPSWSLGPADSNRLLDFIKRSERMIGTQRSGFEGLGYRGFVLTIRAADGEEVVRVGRGVIEFGGADYRDPNGEAERLLIRTIPPDLMAQIGQFLPRPPR